MKKIKILILAILLFVSFGSISKVRGYGDLDLIHDYIITVDPNFEDGSLHIKISIKWEVLNSSSEGPLEWVKIGVPNYHVYNLKKLTSNIKKIKYYSDSGSFIRIDFINRYYAGKVVDFEFEFDIDHMYHLYNDTVVYDYSPGYFDEIKVNNCALKWNNKDVSIIETGNLEYKAEDGYYVLNSPLAHSETIRINTTYNKELFTKLDPKKQYTDSYITPGQIILFAFIVGSILGVIIILVIVERNKRDVYGYHRGFTIYRHHYFWHTNRYRVGTGVNKKGKVINPPVNISTGGGHSSGGGGCACACACACAGGGRAGCSMKDFYHTNLKSEKVIKTIEKGL